MDITTFSEDGVYLFENGYMPVRLKDVAGVQSPKNSNVMVSYHGHKWIVAKEDLKGDELPLFSDDSHPEGISSFYKCEIEALNDFDMKSCTEHLRKAGIAFELDADLYIPTAGQLAAMYLYRKELHKALEMVGGTPMNKKRNNKPPIPISRPTLTRPFVSWYTEGVHIIDPSRRASCEVARFIDCHEADGKTWLMNLFTSPECRNQGKATRLIEAAKAYCQKKDVRALYLCCKKDMIPFYERRGFENIHWTKVVGGKATYVLMCPIKEKQPKSNLE